MTTATLDRPIAILYEGTTATWCRGGCGKFRYPYCYVGDRPYCEGCAFVAQIQAVVEKRKPAPIKEKAKLARKQSRQRISAKQLLLDALSTGPASSRDLATKLKRHQNTITSAAKYLAGKGVICVIRESGGGSRSLVWYSLPEDFDQLKSQINGSLLEAVLRQLNNPKTAPELHSLLLNPVTKRQYHLDSIKKALRQLLREGKIVQIDTGFSMYGALTRFGLQNKEDICIS